MAGDGWKDDAGNVVLEEIEVASVVGVLVALKDGADFLELGLAFFASASSTM